MTITIAPSPGYDDGNGAEMNTTPDRVTAFTEEAVREALYAAVEEKGEDYTYPSEIVDTYGICRYAVDGAPSCLVGHVLVRLGVDVDQLAPYEGCGADRVARSFGASSRVAQALAEAQGSQDSGETWGEARWAFDEVFTR